MFNTLLSGSIFGIKKEDVFFYIILFCVIRTFIPALLNLILCPKCSHQMLNILQMYQKAKMIAMIELDMTLEERREVTIEAYCSSSHAFGNVSPASVAPHSICCAAEKILG